MVIVLRRVVHLKYVVLFVAANVGLRGVLLLVVKLQYVLVSCRGGC